MLKGRATSCATYVRHPPFVSGPSIRRHVLDPRRRNSSIISRLSMGIEIVRVLGIKFACSVTRGRWRPPFLRPLGGSSPRLRGKRFGGHQVLDPSRSIPAPAGETTPGTFPNSWARVHPRACGGNEPLEPALRTVPGPSPRLRGKLVRELIPVLNVRSIPAPAGETADCGGWTHVRRVHPRACGGNSDEDHNHVIDKGPSPRLRGKHVLQ